MLLCLLRTVRDDALRALAVCSTCGILWEFRGLGQYEHKLMKAPASIYIYDLQTGGGGGGEGPGVDLLYSLRQI